MDVVGDAKMIEKGQELKQISGFTIFQWKCLAIAAALVALFGGWFQTKIQQGVLSYWMIFSLTGLFPLLTMYIAWKYVTEERTKFIPKDIGQVISKDGQPFSRVLSGVALRQLPGLCKSLLGKVVVSWGEFQNCKIKPLVPYLNTSNQIRGSNPVWARGVME